MTRRKTPPRTTPPDGQPGGAGAIPARDAQPTATTPPGAGNQADTTPAVIVGGWRDTRPQADWRPEDGHAPGAMTRTGRPVRWRQCCKWRRGRVGRERCCGRAAAGKDCCRLHGGAPGSGRPPVHGRYSQALGALREVYHRHLDADTASDPTDELAVMRTGLERLASRAAGGDSPTFRAGVLELFTRASDALRAEDVPGFREAFSQLGDTIRAGKAVDDAFREVFELADRTADRATQFRRVRVAELRVYTEAHIVALLRMIAETVREHVPIELAARVEDALDRRLAVAAGHRALASGHPG